MNFGALITGRVASRDHKVVAVATAGDAGRARDFASDLGLDCAAAHGSYADLAADGSVDVAYVGNVTSRHYEAVKLFLNAGECLANILAQLDDSILVTIQASLCSARRPWP